MSLPKLIISRDLYLQDVTFGKMSVSGNYFCEILELPWKDNEPNVSCIPTGEYRYRVTWSHKFKRYLIELSGVPGRFYIRGHAGNITADTQGCFIFGTTRNIKAARVDRSRPMERAFMDRLAPHLHDDAEGIIEIRDAACVREAA